MSFCSWTAIMQQLHDCLWRNFWICLSNLWGSGWTVMLFYVINCYLQFYHRLHYIANSTPLNCELISDPPKSQLFKKQQETDGTWSQEFWWCRGLQPLFSTVWLRTVFSHSQYNLCVLAVLWFKVFQPSGVLHLLGAPAYFSWWQAAPWARVNTLVTQPFTV